MADTQEGNPQAGSGEPDEHEPSGAVRLDDEVASQQRLQRRRRARLWRQRLVFLVVVLAVLGAGGAAALVYTDRWPTDEQTAPAPGGPGCAAPVDLPLLVPPEVSLSVLNSTDRRGLAGTVATEMRTRGFVVTKVGNAEVAAGPVTVLVRYPPTLLAQARTLAVRIPDAQLAADPAVTELEMVLGDNYAQLLPEDALAAPPAPPAPAPGC